MRIREGIAAAVLGLALGGSSAWCLPAAEPFTSASVAGPQNETERRAWGESKDLVEAIARGAIIYEDPALTAYVQSVADRLFPEFVGRVRVTLLKSPHLNAFAIPDGHIYVNVGLVARFHNEAQLATVVTCRSAGFVNTRRRRI